MGFFANFGFVLDVTVFTMSLAAPNTLKGEETGLKFLYPENPVSCYHML